MTVNKAKNRAIDVEYRFTCKECGEESTIKLFQILDLDDKDLCVSQRCKKCREIKKEKYSK